MSQQPVQRSPNSVGAFIAGLIFGLFLGGTFLTFAILLVGLFAGALLSKILHDRSIVTAGVGYAFAIAIGVFAFKTVRKSVDFLSGLLIGATAGLLGGVTICTSITSGLNNMH